MLTEHDWPTEYGDQLIKGNTESNVAVCCLWTRRERIAECLDADRYSVIGNLYSRAGLSAMLRNLLANPRIRYIVLTGSSLTDSDDALLQFFSFGIDREWKIRGNGGQIDRGIPTELLDEIRKNVQVIDLRRSRDFAAEFFELSQGLRRLPPFALPRLLAPTTPEVRVYPSELMGFTIRQKTTVEAWEEAIWTAMTFGKVSRTDYGLEQREVLGLLSVISSPGENGTHSFPDWAPFTSKDVRDYVAAFLDGREQREVPYDYADRLSAHWGENQVTGLVAQLRRSRDSRRAVASLWDPRVDAESSEPPCLNLVQVVIREGRLHLAAYIRSNDLFRAYPLNCYALAGLQERVAADLDGVSPGALSILSFSAHVYSDCWEACQRVASAFSRRRRPFQQDSRGSFVFRLDGKSVLADHYSVFGDLVQTFVANDTRSLADAVIPFVGRVDHALYLGRELARLDRCRASKKPYIQDSI